MNCSMVQRIAAVDCFVALLCPRGNMSFSDGAQQKIRSRIAGLKRVIAEHEEKIEIERAKPEAKPSG